MHFIVVSVVCYANIYVLIVDVPSHVQAYLKMTFQQARAQLICKTDLHLFGLFRESFSPVFVLIYSVADNQKLGVQYYQVLGYSNL